MAILSSYSHMAYNLLIYQPLFSQQFQKTDKVRTDMTRNNDIFFDRKVKTCGFDSGVWPSEGQSHIKSYFNPMKKLSTLLLLLSVTFGAGAQTVMTLDQFRSKAFEANKSMLAAQKNQAAATELRKAAFAQFFPKISANGTYQWNQNNISLLSQDALLPVGTKMADGSFGFTADQINNKWVDVGGGTYVPLDADGKPFDPTKNPEKILWKNYAYMPKSAMEFDVHNVWIGQVGFVQPVFMGFKIRELYRMAQANEGIASLQADDQNEKLLIEVDEDYWRVVSVYNKRQLAQKYVELLEKLNDNVAAMVEEGVATKSDAYSVKVKLNEARMSLEKAENGLALSRMALFQLCGMPLESDVVPADYEIEDSEIEPVTVEDIESTIANRTEIKTLEYMDKLAASAVNLQASTLMPNLVVTGNYMISNPNIYNGFSKSFKGGFNAGVTLNVPICQWGKEIHALKAAKYQREALQYRKQDAEEKIRLQITQQRYKILEADKKLESARSNVESADENLRFATEAYNEGMISLTDLMGAQTSWLGANSDRIDASIDVVLCDLYLRRAQGQLQLPESIQHQNNQKNHK